MLLCKSAAGTSSSVEDESSCKGSTNPLRASHQPCKGDTSCAEIGVQSKARFASDFLIVTLPCCPSQQHNLVFLDNLDQYHFPPFLLHHKPLWMWCWPPSLLPLASALHSGSSRKEDTCLLFSHAGAEGIILSDQGWEETFGGGILQSRAVVVSEFP